MGFQSDIYLGWVGKDAITEVMGEQFYATFALKHELQHCREAVVPRDTILAYLKDKYGYVPEGMALKRSAFEVNETFAWDNDGEDVGEESHILGVQLTGRYMPTFLDFWSEHGGLYVKLFDRDLLDDIEWFRGRLMEQEALKYYATATIFVRDNWY